MEFVVDSAHDDGDANPGDGIALTADGKATLRAAVEEANVLGGSHTITFDLDTMGTCEIDIGSPLVVLTDLTITTTAPGDIVLNGGDQTRFSSFPSCTWERTCLGSCASYGRVAKRNLACKCVPKYNLGTRGYWTAEFTT